MSGYINITFCVIIKRGEAMVLEIGDKVKIIDMSYFSDEWVKFGEIGTVKGCILKEIYKIEFKKNIQFIAEEWFDKCLEKIKE